jgi:ubiquinone/menaquinone biosynthesis C-methylase UbiE
MLQQTQHERIFPGSPCSWKQIYLIDKRWRFISEVLATKGKKPELVLDSGCGYCIYTQRLSSLALRIIGLDIFSEYLKDYNAIMASNVMLVQGSAVNLPLPSNVVNAVICIELR